MLKRWQPARLWKEFASKLCFGVALTFIASGCTKGSVELSSAGSTLSGPKFSGKSTITLTADRNTTSIPISGTCDARIRSLEIKLGEWTPLTSFSSADADCRDQSFAFSLLLNQVVNDLNTDADYVLPMRGQTAAGPTDGSTVIIQYRADGISIPTLAFAQASQTVNENVGTVSVALTLSQAASQSITVPLSVSGTATSTDQNASSTTLTIPAGTTTFSYTFLVFDDTVYESDESVVLTLGTPTHATLGTTTVHTVTIHDDDPMPSLSSNDGAVTEGSSGGTANAIFAVNLSEASALPVFVNYTTVAITATQGTDYTAVSGTLTIPAGSTQGEITVPIVGDSLYEDDETFKVVLSSAVNATIADNEVTCTILNDDAAPTVRWATSTQTVLENAGTLTLTAALSAVSGKDVTVPLTYDTSGSTPATSSVDYIPIASLTIPAGLITKSITLTIIDDSAVEGNETFNVTMLEPSGATLGTPSTQAITIQDNDVAATIASVTSSFANAWYGISAVIPIQLVFTAPVTVTGTPKLQLTGGGSAFAYYVSGSGTSNLTFNYVVTTGDATADLDYVSTSSLSLNGGTIFANGAAVVTTLPNPGSANSLAGQKAIGVDGVQPTAPLSIDDGGYFVSATSTPTMSWADATDVNSGIRNYDVAIGTVAGSTDCMPWTDVGLVHSVSLNGGCTYTSGQMYYASVRAHDNAGNISSVKVGDGWLAQSPWAQQAYLKGSLNIPMAHFAYAVAISNDLIAVGVPDDDNSQTTITDGASVTRSGTLSSSGAVYIFARSGSNWVQEAYLKASNAFDGNQFGASVAISGDTVVVGSPSDDTNYSSVLSTTSFSMPDRSSTNSGSAYVFVKSSGTWSLQAYLKPPNNYQNFQYGSAVSISGNTIIVGAPGESSNQSYVTNGNTASSNMAYAGAGAAYVYQRSGSYWQQQAYLKASNVDGQDRFGESVAIDSDTAIVGASKEDSSQTTITNGITSSTDNTLINGGAAYVFARSGSTWAQQAYLKAPNADADDGFGTAVAVSANTVVVGAPYENSDQTTVTNGPGASASNSSYHTGAAYVFVRTGTAWAPQAYLKAPNPGTNYLFGSSIGIDQDLIVVGSKGEASPQNVITNGSSASTLQTASTAGAAYVFARYQNSWMQTSYLKPANASASQNFGLSVGISNRTIVSGAPFEDSSQSTVSSGASGGTDGLSADSGAAYVFKAIP